MAKRTPSTLFYCSADHVDSETVSTDRYKLMCRMHMPVYLFPDAQDDMCSGCEQSYPDHTALKLLLGLARQTFRPDCASEEPVRRPVRTPVSVPVMLPVGLRRSGSSGSQQNTFF